MWFCLFYRLVSGNAHRFDQDARVYFPLSLLLIKNFSTIYVELTEIVSGQFNGKKRSTRTGYRSKK